MHVERHRAPAAGKRRVIGDRRIEVHERQDGPREPFRLAQRQIERRREQQHRLDRHVGVPLWPTPAAVRRWAPRRQGIICDPETDIPALNEAAVVVRPVGHAVLRLRDAMTAGLIVLVRHESWL
ncbi:MAG: hypothetical protein AAGG09_18300, partial [Pseudomonadota bacterium]